MKMRLRIGEVAEGNVFKTVIAIFVGFLLIPTMLVKTAVYVAFDMPQAATYDEGKTISYFEIPSEDQTRYIKVYPSSKKYMEIMREGRYGLIHIAPPGPIKEAFEQMKRDFQDQQKTLKQIEKQVRKIKG